MALRRLCKSSPLPPTRLKLTYSMVKMGAMKYLLAVYLIATPTLMAQIPGMDMAVMQKWSNAKVIRYQVSGLHNARKGIIFGDHEGKADVTDKINVEFTFSTKTGKIVGEPKITDFPSTIANIKADGTNCPPPQLNGSYEHFTMTKYSVSNGNQIQITGSQTFPNANVSQYPASCSFHAVAGGKVEKNLFLTVVQATLLGMPIPKEAKGMAVTPDKKSIIITGADNWVWTYTPTVVE